MTKTPGSSRTTRQRIEIVALLHETGEFKSAQRLHAELRTRGVTIGLTTVYRTLQALAEAGEVDATRLPNGEQLYRWCSATHHHHLVCRECARTVEVPGPTVEAWTKRVARQHGFTEVGHSLELFGTCGTCAGNS